AGLRWSWLRDRERDELPLPGVDRRSHLWWHQPDPTQRRRAHDGPARLLSCDRPVSPRDDTAPKALLGAPVWCGMLAWWHDRDHLAVRSLDDAESWTGRGFLARAASAAEHHRGMRSGSPVPALLESSPDALARVAGAST